MQMLNVSDNQELQTAKNFMFWSLIGYAICCFVIAIPFINFLSFIGMIASFIVGMIGLYKFSKLCNTFVFRLYLFSFLLGIGFQIVGWTCIVLTGFSESTIPLVILAILAIGYYALIIYWAYLMSYEMSARTNLKEFIVSFKLSIIAIFGLVACVSVLSGILASVLLETASDLGGLENLSAYELESAVLFFVDSYTATLIALGGLGVFLFGVAIASFVFLLMGVYKIQEVSVREVNTYKPEKTSHAGD